LEKSNSDVSGCKTFTAGYDKLGDLTNVVYSGNSHSNSNRRPHNRHFDGDQGSWA
jgi:hypothetical protein